MKTTMVELISLYEAYIIHKLLDSSDHKIVVERNQYEKDIATMESKGYVIHLDFTDDELTFKLITNKN